MANEETVTDSKRALSIFYHLLTLNGKDDRIKLSYSKGPMDEVLFISGKTEYVEYVDRHGNEIMKSQLIRITLKHIDLIHDGRYYVAEVRLSNGFQVDPTIILIDITKEEYNKAKIEFKKRYDKEGVLNKLYETAKSSIPKEPKKPKKENGFII